MDPDAHSPAMQVDTLILGAGAAGLMCAAHTGGRVLIIDKAKAPGEKIRISGGGRCNFTNLGCDAGAFLSRNPHFAKSALSRYTQWDFLDLVQRHGVAWHEKTLGQLFCDRSAKDIIALLLEEAKEAELWLTTEVEDVRQNPHGFQVALRKSGHLTQVHARSLVVATGGKSIPKMGATGQAYDIARQFGLPVTETRPALVPLTFSDQRFAPISGVSVPGRALAGTTAFDEAILFTHRGLSGPAILQASSYWHEGTDITLDLVPGAGLAEGLIAQKRQAGGRDLTTELAALLPERLVGHLAQDWGLKGRLADQSDRALHDLEDRLHAWTLRPTGSEGYRTAEVTLGGVDTEALSAKTLEAKSIADLYFIGECVDVTGWLGGYNFQWAWSSGWAAGTAIATKDAQR